ncbi:MAG: chlorophyll a/b-binding protein [Thermosynechococcaceae cyanobacterium MS004]|nr:chlorophyll a/b-binding protein [Thermosynechococcaceae cyanobacterium MS004]
MPSPLPSQESTPPQNQPELEASAAENSVKSQPAFGWTAYAEQINGRFAMIGLVSLLVLEVLTHKDFLTWLGLR